MKMFIIDWEVTNKHVSTFKDFGCDFCNGDTPEQAVENYLLHDENAKIFVSEIEYKERKPLLCCQEIIGYTFTTRTGYNIALKVFGVKVTEDFTLKAYDVTLKS